MMNYTISSQDRMFCYLWSRSDLPGVCKFGETWVHAGEDPHTEVWNRINASQQVSKQLVENGTITLSLENYWDVSDYAQQHCPRRFKPHGKVDDYIRNEIGNQAKGRGDWHNISAVEMSELVKTLLTQGGQALSPVMISQPQHDAAVQVIQAVRAGKHTIMAELCARFGKTIWSAVLMQELQPTVAIVASYVLSSFASFRKELTQWEQFSKFSVIDSAEPEWQMEVDLALANQKLPVVFLSMVQGSKRDARIGDLFRIPGNRLVIIDEADFGVHKENQSSALIAQRAPQDTVVLMTGTRAERAVGSWGVDHYLSVTYPELLMCKNQARLGNTPVPHSELRAFAIDPQRHALYVNVEFYQMSLLDTVEEARVQNPNLFVDGGVFLPSWTKFAADPQRASGFWTYMLQALFYGRGNDPGLNVQFQTRRSTQEGRRVAMLFLPGSTTNVNLDRAVALARGALGAGVAVQGIYGGTMTNRTAEREIEQFLKDHPDQDILLISAGMAQRSFSIPDITELYLAYDGGDRGTTVQKMSRALTPNGAEKTGRIFSLSFEPNRDDRFDEILLETAKNYAENHADVDANEALARVLRTVDIFRCQPEGAVRMDLDLYLEEIVARDSLSRVIANLTSLHDFTDQEIQALAQGNSNMWRAAKQAVAQRGKTRAPDPASKTQQHERKERVGERIWQRAREMVATIIENLDIIQAYGGKNSTIEHAFACIDRAGIQAAVREEFGCDYEIIRDMVLNRRIPVALLEMKNRGKKLLTQRAGGV
jgi:hypothetical protein